MTKGVGGFMTDGSQTATPTVGGFMTDARKTYNTTFQQEIKSSDKGSGRQKQKKKQNLMPIRKQAQHRISKINMQRKIKGPGNTLDDAMVLD